jgi:hypothetical protein
VSNDDERFCSYCTCEEEAHGCLGDDPDDPDNDCTGCGECPGFDDDHDPEEALHD